MTMTRMAELIHLMLKDWVPVEDISFQERTVRRVKTHLRQGGFQLLQRTQEGPVPGGIRVTHLRLQAPQPRAS